MAVDEAELLDQQVVHNVRFNANCSRLSHELLMARQKRLPHDGRRSPFAPQVLPRIPRRVPSRRQTYCQTRGRTT